MPLRGKKPEHIDKRLKLMLYGSAGYGKTTAAIQFPKPYMIDTERGAENDSYAKLINERGGAIFSTSDFAELVDEIKTLTAEKHDYRTLVIDPINVVYDQLLEVAEAKVGTEFGRHYGEANKHMKRLVNLLYRLDMNVVMTAHAKTVYGDGMKKIGETFEGWKKLDYVYDLVIQVEKRGTDRVGRIVKTRLDEFPLDDIVDPFNFDAIAERYNGGDLSRVSEPVVLASADSLAKLGHLVDLLKLDDEVVTKWLKKAEASELSDMTEDQIQACINWCKKQTEDAA